MIAPGFRKALIAGAVLCGVAFLLISGFPTFVPRWRGLKDGMTEAQVKSRLGSPDAVGTSGCIGSGGKEVLRWDYRRSLFGRVLHYYVDFDYIGVDGAPVVHRIEFFREERTWPSWWPWQGAKARA